MSDNRRSDMGAVVKGVLTAIVLTFILLLIIAVVCYFMNISDRVLSVMVFTATGLSVLCGAILATKNVSGAGLLHGGVLGLGYLIIMLLANIISKKGFFPDSRLVTMLICVVACGMLGGILGINAKK